MNRQEQLEQFANKINDANNRFKATEAQTNNAKAAYYRGLDHSYELLKECYQRQQELIAFLLTPVENPLESNEAPPKETREDNL